MSGMKDKFVDLITSKKGIALMALFVLAVIFIRFYPLAIVLPSGHIGSITQGDTVTFYVDTKLWSGSSTVEDGKIWFVVMNLDETQTIYTSEKKTVNLMPGQDYEYQFVVMGSTTQNWLPGEYKLIIQGHDAEGLPLTLDGSLDDINHQEEGGVAWQFTVLPGSTPTTCNQYCLTQQHVMCTGHWQISGTYPNCNCQWICDQEDQDGTPDPTMTIIAVIIVLVIFAILIYKLRK